MDINGFLNMFGLGKRDTVTVNALDLQKFIKESKDKDLLIEELSNSNNILLSKVEELEKELYVKDNKHEKCLDHNDELYNTVIKQHTEIKELRSILENTNTRLSKALHKAKDAEKLKDQLVTANALMEYRKNQNMIDKLSEPLKIDLY